MTRIRAGRQARRQPAHAATASHFGLRDQARAPCGKLPPRRQGGVGVHQRLRRGGQRWPRPRRSGLPGPGRLLHFKPGLLGTQKGEPISQGLLAMLVPGKLGIDAAIAALVERVLEQQGIPLGHQAGDIRVVARQGSPGPSPAAFGLRGQISTARSEDLLSGLPRSAFRRRGHIGGPGLTGRVSRLGGSAVRHRGHISDPGLDLTHQQPRQGHPAASRSGI